jgi:hypothetical protein
MGTEEINAPAHGPQECAPEKNSFGRKSAEFAFDIQRIILA